MSISASSLSYTNSQSIAKSSTTLDQCINVLHIPASFYKNGVDQVIHVGYAGCECLVAASSVIQNAWSKGMSGLAQDSSAYCLGITDWNKAKKDFSTKEFIVIGPTGKLVYRRGLPERIGAAVGHMANGVAKAVSSVVAGTGLTMYGVGSICNGANLSVSGDFMNTSKVLAAGVNGFLHYASTPVCFLTKTVVKTAAFTATQVVTHPTWIATTGVPLVGSGGFFYLASCDVVKAKNASDQKAWQAFYSSRAAFWTTLALSVPGIMSAASQS